MYTVTLITYQDTFSRSHRFVSSNGIDYTNNNQIPTLFKGSLLMGHSIPGCYCFIRPPFTAYRLLRHYFLNYVKALKIIIKYLKCFCYNKYKCMFFKIIIMHYMPCISTATPFDEATPFNYTLQLYMYISLYPLSSIPITPSLYTYHVFLILGQFHFICYISDILLK